MWRCEECCHCPRPNLLCALLRCRDLSQKYYHHLELGKVCLIWQTTRKTSFFRSGVWITFLNTWRRSSSISAKPPLLYSSSYLSIYPSIYLSIYLLLYQLGSQMKSAVAEKLQQNVSPGASNTARYGHRHNWPSPHYTAPHKWEDTQSSSLDTWILDSLVCSSLHCVSSSGKSLTSFSI